jgi:transposase-like protein
VKKQSKTTAIRTLLTQGRTVADVAKKLKVKPAAVYQVRYRMKKEEPEAQGTEKYWAMINEVLEQGKTVAEEARKIDPVNTPLAYSAGTRGKYAVPEPVQEVVQVSPDDPVNHPSHYMVGGIETIDFIRAKNFSYLLGNVIKYVSRSQHKGHYLEDLKKAQWYLNRAIREILTDDLFDEEAQK